MSPSLGATGWSLICDNGNSKVLIIKHFQRKSVNIVLPLFLAYVICALKNRLIETVLLYTHNICFG